MNPQTLPPTSINLSCLPTDICIYVSIYLLISYPLLVFSLPSTPVSALTSALTNDSNDSNDSNLSNLDSSILRILAQCNGETSVPVNVNSG